MTKAEKHCDFRKHSFWLFRSVQELFLTQITQKLVLNITQQCLQFQTFSHTCFNSLICSD